MYKQYKDLLDKEHIQFRVDRNGKSQIAASLTVAHMLDHMVCLKREA